MISIPEFLSACRKFQDETGIAVSFYSKGELFGVSWSFDDDDCPPILVDRFVEILSTSMHEEA